MYHIVRTFMWKHYTC